MRARETPLPLSPDAGLLTGLAIDPGDITLTEHLVAPEEFDALRLVAEAILLDLQIPHVLPVYQELFSGEPPHAAAGPPEPGA